MDKQNNIPSSDIDYQIRRIWHDLHADILRYKPALLTLLTEYADGASDSLKQSVYRNPGIYAGNADNLLFKIGMERFLLEQGSKLASTVEKGYKPNRVCEAIFNVDFSRNPSKPAEDFINSIVYAITRHPYDAANPDPTPQVAEKRLHGKYICHGLHIRSSLYDVLKSTTSPKAQKKLSKQLTKLQSRPCIRIVRQILKAPATGVTWAQFRQDNASNMPVILAIAQCAFRASEVDLEYYFNAVTDRSKT